MPALNWQLLQLALLGHPTLGRSRRNAQMRS
jgi:hypothetical protein